MGVAVRFTTMATLEIGYKLSSEEFRPDALIRYAALALVGTNLVYYLAPAVKQRWHWITPGSVVAVATWLLASTGLRFYVIRFANYNATYGSIGGVILLLLWLYVTGLVLLIGAEVNAEIAKAEAAAEPAPARAPVAA